MDFIDQLKQFSMRVQNLKNSVKTEEATKTSIIMPFFSILGYDVFNPDEFIPEFVADVGIKKGEKIDYAIMSEGNPIMLIEAKSINENLDKYSSQLFRYFGATKTKLAVLTNGLIYRFYTDLDAPNKMDENPFLEINILDIKENQIRELKKFQKSDFNINNILDSASELKYTLEFKKLFMNEMNMPSDDFIRFFLSHFYNFKKTQSAIERFRPIVKKSLNDYINELMKSKIETALKSKNEEKPSDYQDDNNLLIVEKKQRINTTEEELEAFFLIKNILREFVSPEKITHKDTSSYFGVLYDNNTWKWICRFSFGSTKKELLIPDKNKNYITFKLNGIYDIENYKDELIDVLNRYI